MRKLFARALALWLPLVVAFTGVFGFAYLAVQQNYRQLANDPQMQIAETAALSLSKGGALASLVQRGEASIDIATNIASWIVVYDASGTPLESNAVLEGAPPHLPSGLFDASTWRSQKTFIAPTGVETHITWQPASPDASRGGPRNDVRQAVILVHFTAPSVAGRSAQTGWVAVGRSLRVVEDRIIDLTYLAAIAWSVTALASFVVICAVLLFLT